VGKVQRINWNGVAADELLSSSHLKVAGGAEVPLMPDAALFAACPHD